jgi:hypothetical protein
VNSIAKEIKKLLTALLRYLFSTLLSVTLKTPVAERRIDGANLRYGLFSTVMILCS